MSNPVYLPQDGWSNQKYLPASNGYSSQAGNGYLRFEISRSYNILNNTSTFTIKLQAYSKVYDYEAWPAIQGGTLKLNGTTFCTFSQGSTANTHYVETNKDTAWRYFKKNNSQASWTVENVPHDTNGKLTATFATDFYVMTPLMNGKHYVMRWQNSASINCDEARGSTISSLPASVETLGTANLAVTRYNSAFWHKVQVKDGGTTLWTSDPFETSANITPPRSWLDSHPSDASVDLTVSVQTYTDNTCTTAVGPPATQTLTLLPDAGMAPTLDASFVTVSAYNTDTAASGIAGFVQGYSKAKLRLTKSAVTTVSSATVASYAVACQGETNTVDSPDATEDVLTGTLVNAEDTQIVVTVTDSRGLTASVTVSVTPMSYAPPTISNVEVFRCDPNGTANESGNFVSVKATGNKSSLIVEGTERNALTLTAQTAVGSASYGTAATLTSGTASVLGGSLDPDQKLRVLITATDSLGNTATALREFPTRKWAMKFCEHGDGVAFGKAPEYGPKVLELPDDWTIKFVGNNLVQTWLERVYPVGSIYMSVNSTDPGTLFGGTWQQIEDTFLLAAGQTYTAGDTGGEAAHTLTTAELPAHSHNLTAFHYIVDGGNSINVGSGNWKQETFGSHTAGSDQAHNNMPPYLAVYVWQRTA